MIDKFFDFDEDGAQTVGSQHTGLTQKGGGAIVAVPRLVDEVDLAYKERYLELKNDDLTENHSVAVDAVGTFADVKALFVINMPLFTAGAFFAYFRASSATEWYRLKVNVSGNRLAVECSSAAIYTFPGEMTGVNVTWDLAASYFVLFELYGEDKTPYTGVCKVKYWKTTEVEPSTYAFSVSPDGEVATENGWFAMAAYHASVVSRIAAINCARLSYLPPNLLSKPREFDNAAWTKTSCTVTANAIAAPDGSTTADLIVNGGGVSNSVVAQTVTVPASFYNNYMASVYVKQGTAAAVTVQAYYTGNPIPVPTITYTFATGAVVESQSSGYMLHARATSVGSGWIRLQFQVPRNLSGAATTVGFYIWPTAGVGSVGQTYVWDARLEVGNRLSPHLRVPATPAIPLTNLRYWAWLESMPRIAALAMLKYLAYDPTIATPYAVVATEYIGTSNYVSGEGIAPASKFFKKAIKAVPSYEVRLGGGLAGPSTVSFGDLVVHNQTMDRLRRQNLVPYSNDLSNALWTKSNVTATANNTTSHDGKLRASRLLETATVTVFHDCSINMVGSVTAGLTYVLSAKIKANGRTTGQIGWYTTGPWTNYPVCSFDLSAKTVSANAYVTSASLTQLDEGWFLLRITALCTVTTATPPVFLRIGDAAYTGDVTKGLFFDDVHVRRATASDIFVGTTTTSFDETGLNEVTHVRAEWPRRRWSNTVASTILIGQDDWPLPDWRKHIVATLKTPLHDGANALRFQLKDIISSLTDKPITSTRFGSGGNLNKNFHPVLFGGVRCVELMQENLSTLTYRIASAVEGLSLGTNRMRPPMISDNGVVLTTRLSITGVNDTTDTLTLSANHGLAVNAMFYWVSGTLPTCHASTPWNTTTLAFVKSVPAANQVTLSLTRGGTTVDITNTTTGAIVRGNNFYFPNDGADGTVVLLQNPTSGGRLLAGGMYAPAGSNDTEVSVNVNSGTIPTASIADVMADILYRAGGLSLNYKNQSSFDDHDAYWVSRVGSEVMSGIHSSPQANSVKSIADAHANGTMTWYDAGPTGVIRVGAVTKPTAPAVGTLYERDIKPGSMRIIDVIEAIDIENTDISILPWFLTGGPLPDSTVLFDQNRKFTETYILNPPPIDDRPQTYGAKKLEKFICHAKGNDQTALGNNDYGTQAIGNLIAEVRFRPMGIYECMARIKGSRFLRGSTIAVDHRDDEWVQWGASYPLSPDDDSTYDGTLCVVLGHGVNISSSSPFNTRMILAKTLPGHYPKA